MSAHGCHRRLTWVVVFFGAVFQAACASVPPESVQLSAALGRDLPVLHAAHRETVKQYFSKLLLDVDEFVDDEYRPFIIRKTMEELNLVADIQLAARGAHPDGLDPLDLMEIFAEETIAKIQSFREEMRQPIEEQRDQVILAVDDAYMAVIRANAVLTAHLSSIRDVHAAQDEALGAVGLEGLRERTIGFTDKLSAELDRLTKKLSTVDDKGAEFEGLAQKLRDAISKLKTEKSGK